MNSNRKVTGSSPSIIAMEALWMKCFLNDDYYFHIMACIQVCCYHNVCLWFVSHKSMFSSKGGVRGTKAWESTLGRGSAVPKQPARGCCSVTRNSWVSANRGSRNRKDRTGAESSSSKRTDTSHDPGRLPSCQLIGWAQTECRRTK